MWVMASDLPTSSPENTPDIVAPTPTDGEGGRGTTGGKGEGLRAGGESGEIQAVGSPFNGVVPPPERRWRPGQSGNPAGKPKGTRSYPVILREILALHPSALGLDCDGLPEDATIRDALMARAVERALKVGGRDLDVVMDRTEGKVADKVEHSGKIEHDHLMQLCQQYLNNAEARRRRIAASDGNG